MNSKLLPDLISLTFEAGETIMSLHKKPTNFSIKSDNTPVTEADKASHHLISKTLEKLTPNIPILSEESSEIPFSVRKKWKEYWLIDPLDGTRDFIDGSPDFCISIALINNNYPSFGLIYSPINKVHYYRLPDQTSIKLVDNISQKLITQNLKVCRIGNPIKIDSNIQNYTLDYLAKHDSSFKLIETLKKASETIRKKAFKFKRNFESCYR